MKLIDIIKSHGFHDGGKFLFIFDTKENALLFVKEHQNEIGEGAVDNFYGDSLFYYVHITYKDYCQVGIYYFYSKKFEPSNILHEDYIKFANFYDKNYCYFDFNSEEVLY